MNNCHTNSQRNAGRRNAHVTSRRNTGVRPGALLRPGTLVLGMVALMVPASVGCQVSLNGQTLPSPYYLQDDVQYFPAGPEFKLPREAAALAAAKAEEELQKR